MHKHEYAHCLCETQDREKKNQIAHTTHINWVPYRYTWFTGSRKLKQHNLYRYCAYNRGYTSTALVSYVLNSCCHYDWRKSAFVLFFFFYLFHLNTEEEERKKSTQEWHHTAKNQAACVQNSKTANKCEWHKQSDISACLYKCEHNHFR